MQMIKPIIGMFLLCLWMHGETATPPDLPTNHVEQHKYPVFTIESYSLDETALPKRLMQYKTQPWNLLKFKKFKYGYIKALKGKNAPTWVTKLEVVSSVETIKFCQTPLGIAFLYEGGKPHMATDVVDIVYIPDVNIIGILVKDSANKKEFQCFGSTDVIVEKIISKEICEE